MVETHQKRLTIIFIFNNLFLWANVTLTNCIVQWKPSCFIPHNCGLTLIGDANGFDILKSNCQIPGEFKEISNKHGVMRLLYFDENLQKKRCLQKDS